MYALRRMLVLWRGGGEQYESASEWETEALREARNGRMGAREQTGFRRGLGAAGDGCRPLTAQMSDAAAKELRQKIRAALFVPDPLPALDAKNFGSF